MQNLQRRKPVVVTESPKKTEGEQRAREKWLTWDSVAASFLRGLWFGTHLGNLIPERNYRFEAMLGEVESSNCRSRAAKKRQIRGSAETESPPAAKTPTNRACFPDDARSTRQTPSKYKLFTLISCIQLIFGLFSDRCRTAPDCFQLFRIIFGSFSEQFENRFRTVSNCFWTVSDRFPIVFA